MLANDIYKTLAAPSEEALYKEKNSKFFGYAFPVNDEEEVKAILEDTKKQHHSARHWCYAFQLGTDKIYYRANDDGEPNNTAGMPIYGQMINILSYRAGYNRSGLKLVHLVYQ